MTKKRFFLIVILAWATFLLELSASAQVSARDTLLHRPFQRYELKPIVRGANGRYYYGGVRLRRSTSLEIPFGELDDPVVNRHFKTSRQLNTLGVVISLVPTVYFLATLRNGAFNRSAYWTMYFAGVGGTLACNLLSEGQIRQAVNVYNLRLGNVRMGATVEPLPHRSVWVGWRLTSHLSR